jgi:diguanylate cyclase (GGDEF)-like protein
MSQNNTHSATCFKDSDIATLYKELEDLRKQVQQSEQAISELRRRSDIQEAQNQMLSISLLSVSLREQLQKILLLILHIPWLALEKKGCIFLVDETDKNLKMVAQHNLNGALLTMCANVAFGSCLCGGVASSQQLLFKSCIDADHSHHPDAMKAHGHYVLPIISNQKTLGVLNLYVKHGHKPDVIEHDFLQSSGKLLAGIIERKIIEQKLHRLSYHDDLTGLANRRNFMEYLSHIINVSNRVERHFAVLFLDLDHFKAANDNYGHDYGDEVLVEAARRMKRCVRQSDVVARLGGDEFVACINLLDDVKYALIIGEKIQQAVSQPYQIKNTAIQIGISIGISIYPDHGDNPELLLKKADLALYQAKENRGCVAIYQPDCVQPNCD